MKRWQSSLVLWLVLLVITAVHPSHAQMGYYIEEETIMPPIFGSGEKTLTVTYMTENKLRRDEEDELQTTIIRSDLGKIWLIDHTDKSYRELSPEVFQGMAVLGLMMFGVTFDSATGKPRIPDPLFRKTGRKKLVGNWECHEVVVQKGAGIRGIVEPAVIWVSEDTGLKMELYSRMMRRLMGDLGKEYDAFFRQLEALDGYPVLMESRAMGAVVGQALKKVEEQSMPSSVFTLPEGYKKVDLFGE